MRAFPEPAGQPLSGLALWLSTLAAMSRKEFTLMLRYPVEFVASFAKNFLMVTVFTLATLMFSQRGFGSQTAESQPATAGLMVYGFVVFIFVSDTLWTVGFNVRREQNQGTLEQLYLTPASRSASLISRAIVTLVWTGLLSLTAAWLMSLLIGHLSLANVPLAVLILLLILSGTFGTGFAFAALTLRLRDTAYTLANLFQFLFIVLGAPFFPFASLPPPLRIISRLLPLAYGVDALRATLLNYPAGFPELVPIGPELIVIAAFGVLMPPLGLWLYAKAEDQERLQGSLAEY
jgi:ABC-type polysaccharide/polyol phosphate export permease